MLLLFLSHNEVIDIPNIFYEIALYVSVKNSPILLCQIKATIIHKNFPQKIDYKQFFKSFIACFSTLFR